MQTRPLDRVRSLYTPTMLLLVLAVGISYLGFGFIAPLRSLYARSIGATSIEIGLMASIFLLAGFVAAPIIGRFSDRFGHRNVLGLGLLVHTLIAAAYIPIRSPELILVLRALEGITAAAVLAPARALMNNLAPKDRQGEALGGVSAARTAGTLLGPALGALLADRFGYNVSFLLSSLTLGLATVAVYGLLPRPKGTARIAIPPQRQSAQLFTAPILLADAIGLVLALPVGAFAAIWSLFMLDRGASLPLIGLSYVAYGAPALVVAPIAGRWSDRLGRYWPIVVGVAAVGVIYIVYSIPLPPLWLMIACMSEGVLATIAASALDGMLADLIPRGMEGRAQGNFSAAGTAGGFIGATAAGFLYTLGPGVPFLVSGPICIAFAIALLLPVLSRLFPGRAAAPAEPRRLPGKQREDARSPRDLSIES